MRPSTAAAAAGPSGRAARHRARCAARCALLGAVLAAAGCAPESVLPEPAPATPSAWTLVTPRPFDVDITDLWGPSPDRMLAVGLFGGLLVLEGSTWREAPSPTTTHIWDIDGCDWEHAYAVSEEGLLRFDGKGWRREGPADLDDLARVVCLAPDDVMVVTGGRLSHHWDGRAWTTHPLDLEPYGDAGEWLAGAPDGTYLAVGTRGRFATWHGGAWRAQEPEVGSGFGVRAVAYGAGPPARWYGAGQTGDVWLAVLEDGNWNVINRRSDAVFTDLAVGAAPHLVRVSDAGRIGITNPGRSDILVEGRPLRLSVCAFPTGRAYDDRLVAAGSSGLLLDGFAGTDTLVRRSESVTFAAEGFCAWPGGDFAAWSPDDRVLIGRGGTLTDVDPAGIDLLAGVWGPAADLVYAVGTFGGLCRVRDGTAVELLGDPDGSVHVFALTGRGSELWAGCWQGIARWDGQQWARVEWPFSGSGGSWVAVRDDGGVWAMSDSALGRWDGTAWHAEGPAGALSFHGLVRDPLTDDLLIIARVQENGPRTVWRLRDGAWQDLGHPDDAASRLCAGPDGTVWVTGYNGFHVRRDGAWSPVAPPGGDWEAVAAYTSGGDPSGGLYVSRLTGGIYHLDLGGTGPWR